MLQLPYRYQIVVAGNHDRAFWETDNKHYSPEAWRLLPGIIVLEDEAITIQGIKFYGTSWLRFERDDESTIPKWEAISHNKLWSKIPSDADIVITHLPPFGILDRNRMARNLGSETLREEILGRIKPKVHVFGHVHVNRGEVDFSDTKFVNAALVDEENKPAHQPIVIEVGRN